LVLICILPLPLLVLGTILGIVPSVATSETPVVIALTVLVLWLVVAPLNWGVESGWVPAAATVGSPIVLVAAEVPYS
jgi:hypothetical protein